MVDLQRDALATAACERAFEDRASGAKVDRSGLAQALAYAGSGDPGPNGTITHAQFSFGHGIIMLGSAASEGEDSRWAKPPSAFGRARRYQTFCGSLSGRGIASSLFHEKKSSNVFRVSCE
jgi:hypothetical protein